jgi:phosphatidate cytidylyltransferase
MRFSDLKQRIYTAIILIAVIIFLELTYQISPQTQWCFPVVALLIVGICSAEYLNLCRGIASRTGRYFWYGFATFGPSLILGVSYYWLRHYNSKMYADSLVLGLGVLSILISLLMVAAMGRASLEEAKEAALELTFGSIIIGLGGASLVHLSLLGSHSILFWIVVVVALNDTGAYFVGKKWGKTKLSPFISPGKSVEGAIAGLSLGCVIGSIVGYFLVISLETHLSSHSILTELFKYFLVAAIVGVFGQAFDLAKSFMKRIAGVKDSGSLLPGHGGFLDRLDGVLGAALALHMISCICGITLGQ